MSDNDDTRAQILAAATAVFAAKGFNKASMNDVVRASGLSKGGVYWHFSGKDALLEALFTGFFQDAIAGVETIVAGPEPAAAKLRRLAQQTAADVQALAQQFPSPLEFYALAAREELLTGALQTHFQRYHAQLQTVITEGVAAGDFRAVDPAAAARTLSGLFEGLLLIWAVSPETYDLTAQAETAVDLILTGLQQTHSR